MKVFSNFNKKEEGLNKIETLNKILKVFNYVKRDFFLLRFGLANAINNYQMLKICVVCVGIFFTLNNAY